MDKVTEVIARKFHQDWWSDSATILENFPGQAEKMRDSARRKAKELTAALSAAGYRIVPAEPTEAMIATFWDSMADVRISTYLPRKEATKISYRAMLAAAGGQNE